MAGESTLDERLQAAREEFIDADPRERLELLLDFAHRLPPLNERQRGERDAGLHRVQECRTPVFLWIELINGRAHLVGDVAPEAPTVQGFVAWLLELLEGCTPAEIESLPPGILAELGLLEALGMQRAHGMQGVVNRIRRETRRLVDDLNAGG